MTPTQMTTKLQNHQAASMEDTRYTMHSFRITYGVPTGQLKPDRQGVDVDVWVETRGNYDNYNGNYGHEKGRVTTRMGAISWRIREATEIPNYVRVVATAKCYCSNDGTDNWGRRKGIHGMRKSLLRVQWKQGQTTGFFWWSTEAPESR